MQQLTVRLFGGLELGEAGRAPATFPTRRSQSIFAFLVLHHGSFFSRHALCGIFWPESSEDFARKGLRTALWRIRQALEADDIDADRVLHADSRQVGIARSAGVWVDTREFELRTRILTGPVQADFDEESARSLGRAARLYRGHLLGEVYDDWCSQERERFLLMFLTVLERLTSYHESRGEWWRAIGRAVQVLRHDPLREHVHRQLMRCHYAMGNRPAAIRQYHRCVAILDSELGVVPMGETQSLLDDIWEGRALDCPGVTQEADRAQ